MSEADFKLRAGAIVDQVMEATKLGLQPAQLASCNDKSTTNNRSPTLQTSLFSAWSSTYAASQDEDFLASHDDFVLSDSSFAGW